VPARLLTERIDEHVREWDITVETTLETASSFLAFGTRGHRAVVLKVVRAPGDEWQAGEILEIDVDRALQWSFAQAVLSAIWSREDGAAVGPRHAGLLLAHAIQTLVGP